MTTTAAGGSQDGAAPPQRDQHTGWLSPVNVAIAGTTLVAFVLRVYLLARPGVLTVTQYDDGPYFGSAVRLVHGVLPYRDFAFVQPPGITLLMGPVGLVSYLTGTAWGLVIGRLLTILAGAAAVVLAGLLVRHRGVLAVLDPRLKTKGYGRRFLASLPPAPVVHDLAAVERFFSIV